MHCTGALRENSDVHQEMTNGTRFISDLMQINRMSVWNNRLPSVDHRYRKITDVQFYLSTYSVVPYIVAGRFMNPIRYW